MGRDVVALRTEELDNGEEGASGAVRGERQAKGSVFGVFAPHVWWLEETNEVETGVAVQPSFPDKRAGK
jgi:hypothetical protein